MKYFHVMVIFNSFILIHLVSSLLLRFSLYSLKTLNSIYYMPNTHFFSMLYPTSPKRSITMQNKIDPLGEYGSRCRLSYQLSPQASKSSLQPIVTFFHTFLGKTLSQFTPEPSPCQLLLWQALPPYPGSSFEPFPCFTAATTPSSLIPQIATDLQNSLRRRSMAGKKDV